MIVANAHGGLLIGHLAFAVATVLYSPLVVHEYAITTSVRDAFPLQIVHPRIFLNKKAEKNVSANSLSQDACLGPFRVLFSVA